MSEQFDDHAAHVLLPWYRKFYYGVGSFGIAITEGLLGTWILFLYVEILKANPAVVGTVLIIPRVFDAITDPIMGQISDRTRGRWGRRRPYIFFGAPLLGFLTFLVFAPWNSLGGAGLAWFIAMTGVLYYAAYTVVFIPYAALGIELSVDYHERTRIQVWRAVIYQCGSFLPGFTWKLSQWCHQGLHLPSDRAGLMLVAGCFGLLTTLALWVTFWGTREEAGAQEGAGISIVQSFVVTFSNRSFVVLGVCFVLLLLGLYGGLGIQQFVTTHHVFGGQQDASAASYMGFLGIITAASGIAGAFFWGWFGIAVDKRSGFIISLFSLALIAPMSWFLFTPAHPMLQLVYSGLLGFSFGALQVFPQSLLADVCDLDEYKTGCRREGAYNGVIALLYKMSAALGPFISGLVLTVVGFDETADTQTGDTILGLRVAFAFLPFAIFVFCAASMLMYPLKEKEVRRIRGLLEARREGQPARARQSD